MNRSPAEIEKIIARAISRIDSTTGTPKTLDISETGRALAKHLTENLQALTYDKQQNVFYISCKKHLKYIH